MGSYMKRMNLATRSLVLLCVLLNILDHVASQPFHSDQESDDLEPAMAKRKAFDSLSGYTFGKRNFDEIDRARFSAFAKRNFDELDRAGFGALHKRNFDELDRAGFGSFHKRNFDELDRNGFGSFNRYFK